MWVQLNHSYKYPMKILAYGVRRPFERFSSYNIFGVVDQNVKKHGNLFTHLNMPRRGQSTKVF